MMNMIEMNEGVRAPEVSALMSVPSWSGKSAEQMTDDEVRDLCDYADKDGWRAAEADACYAGKRKSANPFHADLLGGVPYMLWGLAYRKGTRKITLSAARVSQIYAMQRGELSV